MPPKLFDYQTAFSRNIGWITRQEQDTTQIQTYCDCRLGRGWWQPFADLDAARYRRNLISPISTALNCPISTARRAHPSRTWTNLKSMCWRKWRWTLIPHLDIKKFPTRRKFGQCVGIFNRCRCVRRWSGFFRFRSSGSRVCALC